MALFSFGLKKAGILGMNSRNLDYIFKENKRVYYANVDDKLLTKKLALEADIPVPKLYGVIEYQEQLKHLPELLEKHKSFVIKPAMGSGGGGIMVIKNRNPSYFIKPNGKTVSLGDVRYHISNILAGLYALGGLRDKAIIESRVRNADVFKDLAYQGVPDIRLVIYKGVPAMAMLRLPTHESDGRANLHSGGIGVGICLATGITSHGVLHNTFVEQHSDSAAPLTGFQIPDWDNILTMAVKAGEMVNMGYVGVDIVLDKTKGPMLLEINARPGISIQIANRAGLKARLDTIIENAPLDGSVDARIAFAKQAFQVIK